MTVRTSDIYGNMTWILQRNSGYGDQFTLKDTFRVGIGGYSGRNCALAARRGSKLH